MFSVRQIKQVVAPTVNLVSQFTSHIYHNLRTHFIIIYIVFTLTHL
jgi:hypothetical protein